MTGKILLTGPDMPAVGLCINDIDAVRKHAHNDQCYERLQSTDGRYYFIMKDKAGRQIGTSGMYMDGMSREQAMLAVQFNALIALFDTDEV